MAQSPHVPADGHKPRLKDSAWLAHYCLRGLWELVRARIIFARLEAKAIPVRNRTSRDAADAHSLVDQSQIDRITYVLPRISDRLPWRSDCLVQAIAAQDWLSSLGAASEIQIGVEHPRDAKNGEFGAHAWLLYGEQVITGGDISQYHLILSDSRLSPNSDDSERLDRPN